MSKTLIAYASKHGCTEDCAKTLASKINSQSDLCNFKQDNFPDLNDYETVIIGGSIYAGRIQKEITEFCNKNESLLVSKKLGFFICGMSEGEAAEKQLDLVYPNSLLSRAIAKENFGGRFEFDKMNFMEKTIVKKIVKIKSDSSNIHNENIDLFAQKINDAAL